MIEERRKNELIELCREFVQRKSLSGEEGEVAHLVAEAMRSLKYDQVEIDHYGNVIGRMVFDEDGPTILLEGHMDHVDVADEKSWSHDPYGAEISGGRIWGRATSDMKGALAAMVFAADLLRERAKGLCGELVVAGSVHEECFEGVASESIARMTNPDYVVIGEASGLDLKRGQRGRAEIVMETYGKSAHSSNPSMGLNAIMTMLPLLMNVEKEFIPHSHPVLGEGILEVTDIISSPYPGSSVIPDKCRVTFDRRLLPGETKEEVLAQIRRIIRGVAAFKPDIKAEVFVAEGTARCYTGEIIKAERFAPGWLFEESHPFVRKALAGLRSIGLAPRISHYSFCTNGSYYAGKARIPTVGFGPSREELAHVADEYIEIDQLLSACEGYAGIAWSVLSREADQ